MCGFTAIKVIYSILWVFTALFLVAAMSKSAGDIVINLPKEFGYHKLHVHTSKVLGAGSFGSVVRATLDLLPCAAKLLHTVFFQDKDPGEKNFAARFNQECTILQELKHPCIVQFLGVVQDPDKPQTHPPDGADG